MVFRGGRANRRGSGSYMPRGGRGSYGGSGGYNGSRGGYRDSRTNERGGGGGSRDRYQNDRYGGGGRFNSSSSSSFSGRGSYDNRRNSGSGGGGYKRSYNDRHESRPEHRSDTFKRPRSDHYSSSHQATQRRSSDRFGGGSGGSSASRGYSGSQDRRESSGSYRDHRSRPSPRAGHSTSGGSVSSSKHQSDSERRFSSKDYPTSRKPPMNTIRRGQIGARGGRIGGGVGGGLLRRRPDIRTQILKRRLGPRPNAAGDYLRKARLAKMRSTTLKRRPPGASSKSGKKRTENDAESDDGDGSQKKGSDKRDEKEEPQQKESSTKKSKTKKSSSDAAKSKSSDEAKASGDESGRKNGSSKPSKENGEKTKDPLLSPTTGRSLIKLTCVHCKSKCVTFKEYAMHLQGRAHRAAMRRVSLKQKSQLARMRLLQRNAQKEIEEKSEETTELRTQYCQLCRLNYRQKKEDHQKSEDHKSMKNFLMPYCKTCKIGFKSPMAYESHRCSLDHIRNKARLEKYGTSGADDVMELDLDKYTTVDEVGEIDGNIDESELPNDEEKADHESDDKEDEKAEMNVGSEHIKKVEVMYCELCRIYLPHLGNQELGLKRHCVRNLHLKYYIRHKDNLKLRAEAEARKAEREAREKARKEAEKAEKEEKLANEEAETNSTKEETKEEPETDADITAEDKVWEDVDKDLGDLLNEVEQEEDEDSINNERYDRFRYSKKSDKEDEETITNGEEIVEVKEETVEENDE